MFLQQDNILIPFSINDFRFLQLSKVNAGEEHNKVAYGLFFFPLSSPEGVHKCDI